MRYVILILLLLMPLAVTAQGAAPVQDLKQDKGTLIKNIEIQGFVLGDKERFVKLFKGFRNKYLTRDDMDHVLSQIQALYDREGYQELVKINYHVVRRRLIFTVSMTS